MLGLSMSSRMDDGEGSTTGLVPVERKKYVHSRQKLFTWPVQEYRYPVRNRLLH
jgi:hypothetical protein